MANLVGETYLRLMYHVNRGLTSEESTPGSSLILCDHSAKEVQEGFCAIVEQLLAEGDFSGLHEFLTDTGKVVQEAESMPPGLSQSSGSCRRNSIRPIQRLSSCGNTSFH